MKNPFKKTEAQLFQKFVNNLDQTFVDTQSDQQLVNLYNLCEGKNFKL